MPPQHSPSALIRVCAASIALTSAQIWAGCATPPPPAPAPVVNTPPPPTKPTQPTPAPSLARDHAVKVAPAVALWVGADPRNTSSEGFVRVTAVGPLADVDVQALQKAHPTLTRAPDAPTGQTVLSGTMTPASVIALVADPRVSQVDTDATLSEAYPMLERWGAKLLAKPLWLWLMGVSLSELELGEPGAMVQLQAYVPRSLTADEEAYMRTLGLTRFTSRDHPDGHGQGEGDAAKGAPPNTATDAAPSRPKQALPGEDVDFTFAIGAFNRQSLRVAMGDPRISSIDLLRGDTPPDQLDLTTLRRRAASSVGGAPRSTGRFIKSGTPEGFPGTID